MIFERNKCGRSSNKVLGMKLLGENMTDDDVVYIKHCIKNFSGPAALMWLETHLKGD
jgi:hypothetical protein